MLNVALGDAEQAEAKLRDTEAQIDHDGMGLAGIGLLEIARSQLDLAVETLQLKTTQFRREYMREAHEPQVEQDAEPVGEAHEQEGQPADQQRLARLRSEGVQLQAAEASLLDTASRDAARAAQDDANFWFRRWMNSLAIGHGAAFFVIATGLLQAQKIELAIVLAKAPLSAFGVGLVSAGLLPLVVWMQRRVDTGRKELQRWLYRAIGTLSIISAVLFAVGLYFAVGEVWRYARTAEPVAAEQLHVRTSAPAQTTNRHPPSPSSASSPP